MRILNLLVGNDERDAGLEIASGRVRLKFTDDRLVAWSGGDGNVRIGENAIPSLHCARVSAENACEITPRRGRAWLAISGSIDVTEVLGSRSTDLRACFGGWHGRALRDGDELSLGEPRVMARKIADHISDQVADWSGPQIPSSRVESRDPAEVTLKEAPRDPSTPLGMTLQTIRGKNWTDEVGAKFLAQGFRVAMNSDRMGLRLEGAEIQPYSSELPSEPVTPGTIQLPAAGTPIFIASCFFVAGATATHDRVCIA